ncbi:uncharacterized protein LOC135169306 isoform X2 [Diachasmimorpha longicaudata]
MIYPGIPVESTSRSHLEPSGLTPGIYQTSTSAPSVILPQQPLVYTSYNAYCGVPQVQSTFPDVRRHPVTNNSHYTLRAQDFRGVKSLKWHQKSRPRYKEYPQVALQQAIPFPSPVVLYDPLQNQMTPSLPSLNPVYLQSPTCYTQPAATETFSTYNPSAIPQTYYKPHESQQFCLIHDRSPAQLSHQGVQQTQQPPYYPIPTTYTTTKNYGNTSTSFSNSPASVSSHVQLPSNFTNYFNEKMGPNSATKLQPSEVLGPERSSLTCENQLNLNESIFEMAEPPKTSTPPSLPPKTYKLDKYFDDSSNFDFTIEAEKMVSALCSTSLDAEKDDDTNNVLLPLKSDSTQKAYKSWYLDDYPKPSKTVDTQTCHPEDLQSPEVLRRMIYLGCTEMETLLKSSTTTYRRDWLLSLSLATKIALSKSATCFPIYLNDRAFGQDLMNSFLRISNGWLALDNYLNKQPNLSLSQKFDKDLQRSFKAWESATSTLLENITKNFKKLDTSSDESQQENPSHTSSFPGDVSLYLNYSLFSTCPGPITTSQVVKTQRNVSYPVQGGDQKPRWLSLARESKVRTKWTITDNSRNVKNLQTVPALMIAQPETTNIETTMNIWSPSISSGPSHSTLFYSNPSNVTLVSQIESQRVDNSSEGEAINLSAWFASMRNRDDPSSPSQNVWGTRTPRSAFDIVGTSKMDANRQLKTLKNMRMIQSAPWTASQILEDQTTSVKPSNNIEDTKVYMKPGSYNVPKKKGQSRRSRKNEALGFKKSCPQADEVPKPPAAFFDQRKPDEGVRDISFDKGNFSNVTSSSSSTCSQDVRKDVTWKAACASAELLLDALNVKKRFGECKGKDDDFDSNYEASEEEEEDNVKSMTVDASPTGDGQRTNVKTDSWLIQTLNNVGKSDVPSNCPDVGEEGVDGRRDVESVAPWEKPREDTQTSFSLETSHTIAVMTLVDVVGKATYSETVRRFSTVTKPTSSKMSSQKGLESVEPSRETEIGSVLEGEVDSAPRVASGRQRKGKGQSNDKGWSVWYSSRRKQQSHSLGPAAVEKLLGIYRILWRMDATRVFKFPGDGPKEADGSSNFGIEDYRRVIKCPMFLETIGYKLKNHVYRKVEHVIRDFRKIVHNSKVFHKNDKDCTDRIELLSKKLEELVEQNFPDDFQRKPPPAQTTPTLPAAAGSPKDADERDISSRRNPRNT